MISKDFFMALDELEATKGIKKEVFIDALETALAIAYKKQMGTAKAVKVKLFPDKNSLKVFAYQIVVDEVEDKDTQISLEDAYSEILEYIREVATVDENTLRWWLSQRQWTERHPNARPDS